MFPRVSLLGVVAALACSALALGQGKFTNFETPHVKPITTATLQSNGTTLHVVLVCNSADNSVEIYGARPPNTFFQRVPVGLGPATVRWNPDLGRFYTCNFDGDSVSIVRLELRPDGSSFVPFGLLERTTFVGDQPSDIAFDTTNAFAVVTLSGASTSALINANDLSPVIPDAVLSAEEPSIVPIPVAAKAPRQIQILSDDRIYALNFLGGDPAPMANVRYELDLWYSDPANPPPSNLFTGRQLGGLGTTNQAFAITSDGSTMVVVGSKALNFAASGEANVAALPFGFVESHMWVVDIPAGSNPSVRAEAPTGVPPTMSLPSRNLNKDYSVLAPRAVIPKRGLSQPSDVILIENDVGQIQVIAMTAFHSDKVVLLRPNNSTPGGYDETQVRLRKLSPTDSYSVVGPSGIAYHAATNLIYVVSRLDATLRVINPVNNRVIVTKRLNNDPTPNYIRAGRRFLYDAELSSGNGFVSCASCHLNGTTDTLTWDLSDPGPNGSVPPELNGSVNPAVTFKEFPSNKGRLVTQTLQGLVNYEVNPEGQYLLTNAPYHWRGDRASFAAFNPAFVGLLGRGKELEPSQMFQYTTFINSVLHPPNSEQPINRVVEGTLGANPDDPFTATGAKLGIQIFHNFATDGGQGCVGCHSLPDGSDNVFTEGFFLGPQLHPLETAAMRNLKPREQVLQRTFGIAEPLIAVANQGLTHGGFIGGADFPSLSMNFFAHAGVFVYPVNTNMVPPPNRDTFAQAVTQFSRQFDNGTAPCAGHAFTLTNGNPQNPGVLAFFEQQANEANVGLAIIARTGDVYRGFYYDVTNTVPGTPTVPIYREEGTSNLLTRGQLLALLAQPDSVMIAQATPLGGERRAANPSGIGTQLADKLNPPANVTSLPMVPMTYFTDVPNFVNNLRINQATNPPTIQIATNTTLWALRTFQLSALGNFGVDDLHHEPPRRLRVTADNIRPGAKLLVGIPTTNPGAFPVQVLELDLFPTLSFEGAQRVWETEEELDPLVTFAMLNGGPFAPDVVATAFRATTNPMLQPTVWNSFAFAIQNEDGTLNSTIPFAPLEVADVR